MLGGYHDNSLMLLRVARALGHLRLKTEHRGDVSPVRLPSTCPIRHNEEAEIDPLVTDVLLHLESQASRLVIVGVADPYSFIENLLGNLDPQERLRLSFTTGLIPSLHRPFNLQFIPQVNEELRRELSARDLLCVEVCPDEAPVMSV